ncbi:hypothetical protein K0U83_08460 [bacterium]|jgi:hypothetical protein|nr:hypothetical protein [bacterium]
MTYQVSIKKQMIIHEVTCSADLTSASGDDAPWDSLTSSHVSSAVSVSSNEVTLAAGDYVIQGTVAIDRTSIALNAEYTATFTDPSSGSALTESDGYFSASTQGDDKSGSLVLQAQLELVSSQTFVTRVSGVGAAGTFKADGCCLIIMEV